MLAGIDTHKDTLAVAVIDARRPTGGRHRWPTPKPASTSWKRCSPSTTSTGSASRARAATAGRRRPSGAGRRPRGGGGAAVADLPGTLGPARSGQDRPGRRGRDRPDHRPRDRAFRRFGWPSGRPLTCGRWPTTAAQLVAERTALANRTHTELHGLLPGYQAQIPRLTAPTFIAAANDLLADETGVRAQLTRRRLTRLAELTAESRRSPR